MFSKDTTGEASCSGIRHRAAEARQGFLVVPTFTSCDLLALHVLALS